MPSASRITARFSRSAFIWRAIASTRSFGGSMSLISTRVTLMPQGSEAASITVSRRGVDLVAMRQKLVEIHRAHDGADVGHDEIEERHLEIGDFVGRAPRVEHLVEGDAVDGDGRVVLRDDLLARDLEDLLHHVELAADRN